MQLFKNLIVWTGQLGKYSGIDGIDITVKTGNLVFAPTWEMVLNYKNKKISKKTYIIQYKKMMVQSFKNNRFEWEMLANKKEITLLCYCKSGQFCHRLILAKFLENLGALYIGEH